MRTHTRLAFAFAALSMAALTACGSTSTSGSSFDLNYGLKFNTSTVPWLSANQNASGSPHSGGTLKVVGTNDVDHLDTASTYTYWGNDLLRAVSRQLYTYPANTDLAASYKPVADIATDMPTVSSDGTTYTVKLRSDVMWDTSPPRAVTSKDVLFGFKRLCNPVAPAGATGYYTATIQGFADYCNNFSKVNGAVGDIQNYMSSHNISGITTPDDSTVVFKLISPAGDFVNILTVPFSSPAPAEYANYLPDSADLHSHFISDGPYSLSKYTPNQEIDLSKNSAWKQSADPVRHQYLDGIQITLGQTAETVQQQIEAGTADVEWDTTVPPASLSGLQSPSRNTGLGVFPTPDQDPIELFNLQSKAGGGALGKVQVRQALEYAIDKTAIVKASGGSDLGGPLDQIISPSSVGYQQFNLYPTSNHQGDAAKCKSMLAAAGVSKLTLHDVYQNSDKWPAIFQEVQKDFGDCGVTVTGTPLSTGDLFGNYLANQQASASGAWDMSEVSVYPDWHGNNGRTMIPVLFDSRNYSAGSGDFGDYSNSKVNSLMDKALAESDPQKASDLWHQADVQIMQDAPAIPMRTGNEAIFHSSRVHNAIWQFQSLQYDITQIWLS